MRPTALVSGAVEALATQFFEPLAASDLLRDAWEGATAALVTAGRSLAPPPPEYPRDPAAAALPCHNRLDAVRVYAQAGVYALERAAATLERPDAPGRHF